jgi:hypothetical protein
MRISFPHRHAGNSVQPGTNNRSKIASIGYSTMSSLRLSHALHPSAMQETGQLLVNVLKSA